jgi:hypothetical protein
VHREEGVYSEMNEMTYVQVGRQHRRELMREAEQERLAKMVRRDGGKRAGSHRGIGSGWGPRRLAGRLLEGLRTRKNEA